MKKVDLGQTFQVLGNVGVIIGILLLAFELNQNRHMMEAQTRNAISETLVNLQIMLSTSTEQQRIAWKIRSGESPTPIEQQTFNARWIGFFRYWENVNYQYRKGLYDDSEYLAQRVAWLDALEQDAVRRLWCDLRDGWSPEFFSEMDMLLGESACN